MSVMRPCSVQTLLPLLHFLIIPPLSVALLYLYYRVLTSVITYWFMSFSSLPIVPFFLIQANCLPSIPASALHLKLIPSSPSLPLVSSFPNPSLLSTCLFLSPRPSSTQPQACYHSITASSVHSVAINLVNSITPADPSQLIQLTHTQTQLAALAHFPAHFCHP